MPDLTIKLPIGTPVKIRARLVRKRTIRDRKVAWASQTYRSTYKMWESEEFNAEGIVVGWRMLQDGFTTWEEEVGNIFESDRHFLGYLVAWHPNRAIVKVLPQDILVQE
jgi:hypothetical protein